MKKEVRKILDTEYSLSMSDQEFDKEWKKLCVRIAIQDLSLGMESFSTHERARYIAMVIVSRGLAGENKNRGKLVEAYCELSDTIEKMQKIQESIK